MSIESAKAFVERMKTDQELVRKVNDFKTIDEFQSFVAGQGYTFTISEWREVADAVTEADLDAVAGGGSGARPVCPTMALMIAEPMCTQSFLPNR